MEPVATLKRRMPVDMQMCIFCQKKNKGKNDVRKGGKQGKYINLPTFFPNSFSLIKVYDTFQTR